MGNLFNKYMLSTYIDNYRKALMDNIDKLEITDSTNIITLIESLKSKFTIYPIELKDPKPSEPHETTIDRKDVFGDVFKQKVFEISVVIPFDGNEDLFYCQASSSTIVYLDRGVTINPKYVSATITLETLDEGTYFSAVNKIIGTLKSNLPTIHQEINPWNSGLENFIKQSLEKRKGVVSKKLEFMEKIGLKVNPKSNDFLVPPTITKKAIPIAVTDTTKGVKKEVVPILQEELYNDIKEVLYNVGRAIERKPSIYFEKQEEDLRDIFLLFLETRYDSATGVGEAFNKKGKTDILLKYAKDGTNVFVAECKFWRGQKKLLEAISQLLGYLTHRDSKTALIIFVDQKEFTSIITTLKTEIKNHQYFHRFIRDTYEHSFSYEFILPEDSKKIIQIETMLFHFPEL
jgi:hypothetical protein